MIDLLFCLLITPFTISCLYLGLLAIASLAFRRRVTDPGSGSAATPVGARFLILIPAHNEESSLPATLRSLSKIDYPADLVDICVIADNCTDNTYQIALQHGTQALVRNSHIRGKGAALTFAFNRLPIQKYDGIVIIDADTLANHDILRAFHRELFAGAMVMQGAYRVLNPNQSWRTELMNLAFVLVHEVRGAGRRMLGLSCGLKGNGMCFRPKVLSDVPHCGNSITEDLEYTALLALSGVQVVFVPEAIVHASIPTESKAAKTQRERWESGRWSLLLRFARPLLWTGITRKNRIALDCFMEFFTPPLAHLGIIMASFLAVITMGQIAGITLSLTTAQAICGIVSLITYLAIGHAQTGGTNSFARVIAQSLRYAAWKMTRTNFWRHRVDWVRTERVKLH